MTRSSIPLKLNSKYILILVILYITVLLTSDAVSFKFVDYDHMVVSGVTILFPFTYLLGDVIAEVYGYDIARKLIWFGSAAEIIFALLIAFVIALPYPKYANYGADYTVVFGSLLRFIFFGVLANLICALLNVYLISKLKVKIKGQLFWLRSIFSTAVSELVLCGFAVLGGFTGRLSLTEAMHIFMWTYLLELFYSVVFVWPAWGISAFLKRADNIDAYDTKTNYNPFKLI